MFGYMTSFPDFYRDETGEIKKRIVVKVSDFRSARIQGQYLARKGLERAEFRIESGLNCGGHAFPSAGHPLPLTDGTTRLCVTLFNLRPSHKGRQESRAQADGTRIEERRRIRVNLRLSVSTPAPDP